MESALQVISQYLSNNNVSIFFSVVAPSWSLALAVHEQRIAWVGDFPRLRSISISVLVPLVTGRKSIWPVNTPIQLSSNVLFLNKWKEKTEEKLAHPGLAGKLPLVWRRKINVILRSQHPALGSHLAHPGSAEKLPSVWRKKINVILCSQHPAIGSNLPLPVKPAEAALIAN